MIALAIVAVVIGVLFLLFGAAVLFMDDPGTFTLGLVVTIVGVGVVLAMSWGIDYLVSAGAR